MIADPNDIDQREKRRRRIRDQALATLRGLNNSQRVAYLSQIFECRPSPGDWNDRMAFIAVKRGILTNREPRIMNRCRFFHRVEVDVNHMAGYCCNRYFGRCPHYRRWLTRKEEVESALTS